MKNRSWCWPRGTCSELILTNNVFRLLRLEGCLSGKVPKGAKPLPGACAELAEMEPVEFLGGPATFLNEAVVQIDEQLERLARQVPAGQLQRIPARGRGQYGITSCPASTTKNSSPPSSSTSRARGTPKARLAYLFPNSHSAQIVIRLKPDLSEAERRRAIGLIEDAVAETTPRKACADKGKPEPCFALQGGGYVVSGAPVVVDGVAAGAEGRAAAPLRRRRRGDGARSCCSSSARGCACCRWRSRWPRRRSPSASSALVGGSLTMASIAVLPILIGLAVDYAIQFQARFDEATEPGGSGVEAARTAASRGGPTIATACLATAAGFLALLLSPTPMVRGFGLLLSSASSSPSPWR